MWSPTTFLRAVSVMVVALVLSLTVQATASAEPHGPSRVLPIPFFSGGGPDAQARFLGHPLCDTNVSTTGWTWTLGYGPVCGGVVWANLLAYDGPLVPQTVSGSAITRFPSRTCPTPCRSPSGRGLA